MIQLSNSSIPVDLIDFLNLVATGPMCWEWQGSFLPNGYGRHKGKLAHRASYELFVGPIPEGLVLDHLCRRTSCVRPDHVEAVTQQENIKRGIVGSKDVCVNGHIYDAINTYLRPDGRRDCRACKRDRERQRRLRAKS